MLRKQPVASGHWSDALGQPTWFSYLTHTISQHADIDKVTLDHDEVRQNKVSVQPTKYQTSPLSAKVNDHYFTITAFP